MNALDTIYAEETYIKKVKERLNSQEIISIIPINAKNLKLKFVGLSYTPSFVSYFLICIVAWFVFSAPIAFVLFILGDLGVSFLILIITGFFLLTLSILLITYLYTSKIKKYPQVFIVLTEKSLACVSFKNTVIDIFHEFSLKDKNISEILYGEIDSKTNKIGSHFEIKINNKKKIVGKINLFNGKLKSNIVPDIYIISTKDLAKIYKS